MTDQNPDYDGAFLERVGELMDGAEADWLSIVKAEEYHRQFVRRLILIACSQHDWRTRYEMVEAAQTNLVDKLEGLQSSEVDSAE